MYNVLCLCISRPLGEETVVQLHFGHGQVIGIDTQVGGEETLNVPFALYAAAYR